MSAPEDRARIAREVQGELAAWADYYADRASYHSRLYTAAEFRERARLWRVALAAVRADARKRNGGKR